MIENGRLYHFSRRVIITPHDGSCWSSIDQPTIEVCHNDLTNGGDHKKIKSRNVTACLKRYKYC